MNGAFSGTLTAFNVGGVEDEPFYYRGFSQMYWLPYL